MKKLFLLFTAIFCLAMTAAAQRTVTGTVVDAESGEPLVAATVLPIGGGTGVATDIDGNFTLSLPGSVKEIRFSYVGYDTQTLPVSSNMQVALLPNNKLETVVVTGYGSGKKLGSVVGSVSVVGEEQFQNVPTATFVDALQGQVAGLNIFSASGDPSSNHNSIRMRGVNSINADVTPLFILDGAPVTETVFTTLNPNDIESVTVLKDASSVAIYGSRAANGVIVITTKKGKFGEKAKVTLRANYGWSQMTPDKVEMMDSKQYIEYRQKIGQPVSQEAYDAAYVLGIDTDWRKEIFTGHAPTYSIEAAVQGGSESLSYYVSLNHYDAKGIIDQSDMRRETLRFSLAARINPWFRVGLQANLGYTKYQTNSESNATYSNDGLYVTNPMLFARKTFPYDSPNYYTFDENGNVVWGEASRYLHFSQVPTPNEVLSNRSVWNNRVTANVTLSEQINPIKGLTIRAQQNVDAYDARSKSLSFPKTPFTTPMGDYYDNQGYLTGSNSQSFGRYYSFTYTNTAEYNFTVDDDHNISLLAGQESIISRNDGFGVFTGGFTDKRLMLLDQGLYFGSESGTQNSPAANSSQTISETTFNSFFFNGSYDYDNKYFIQGTFRRDGSSKFSPKDRWANFWSVGAMWNAKAESFLTPYTWLDDLKLHVSYGTTGNSGIGNYAFYGLIGQGSLYNGEPSYVLSQPSNYDLTWETVRAFEVGVNFGFCNILTGEVNFYNKETVDMLLEIPFSVASTGFSGAMGNVGSMRNTGVDINLQADIIKNRDWFWDIRANFNYNHNEITKLYNGLDELALPDYGLKYQVGHDAGELYTVPFLGIDPRDGQQVWLDRDGNPTKYYNEERDARLIGKSMFAPLSGGFGTDLRWKEISLRVDFNWAGNKYMTNNDRYFIENNNFASQWNQMTSMLDVWTKPGDVTKIPAANGQSLQFDSHLVENASFLRLKNVTLQYTLPRPILNRIKLDNVTFHFTGRNLFTVTGFSGYDPEPERNLVTFLYPNTRQFEFGVELGF